jgi:hypothetical protein
VAENARYCRGCGSRGKLATCSTLTLGVKRDNNSQPGACSLCAKPEVGSLVRIRWTLANRTCKVVFLILRTAVRHISSLHLMQWNHNAEILTSVRLS